MNFKFVVASPETRKSYKIEVDQEKTAGLIGKKIKDRFNGDLIGLKGYEIEITGGTDKDGFPMHPQVHGTGRKRIVLSNPPCFHPERKGQRKRKTVVGNALSTSIIQVNCKIIKKGSEPIEKLLGKEEKDVPKEEAKLAEKDVKEAKAEKPKEQEAKKEVKKAEEKPVDKLKENSPEKQEPKKEAKEKPKEDKNET